MKRISLILLLLSAVFAGKLQAKDGYRIKLKFTDYKDSLVYLVHYYAKPLPTIYKTDSVRVNKQGEAVFSKDSSFLGGIYMCLLADRQSYFEFLLDNGDNMEFVVTKSKLPDGIVVKNSKSNTDFYDYVKFLQGFGQKDRSLQTQMGQAKTAADSAVVRQQMIDASKELTAYRRNYRDKNKGTLLASIFGALESPQVPEGPHYLSDGKTVDSNFSYFYYKNHYWDNFDFKDDRLMNTPVYDGKLEEYFTRLVLPTPDSMNKECDVILAKVRGRKELFKYTLWWLTKNAESSKIMGMDQVFVYLVENYYMKGDAYWLDAETLQKYIKRSQDIAPNVIGNIAPELKLKDAKGVPQSLSAVKARYTLLIFYSPDCGHCIQEIPKIDSLYRAELKSKGMRVYAVATEDPDKWNDFIKKNKLDDWINVADWERTSDYRSKYDVYSTPVIYLLDEKKIIRGKRLDHTNIAGIVDMLEKKEKKDKDPSTSKK